ncbi:MAG: hypothetical protein ACEY3K_17990 [Wolbachia sp.]
MAEDFVDIEQQKRNSQVQPLSFQFLLHLGDIAATAIKLREREVKIGQKI